MEVRTVEMRYEHEKGKTLSTFGGYVQAVTSEGIMQPLASILNCEACRKTYVRESNEEVAELTPLYEVFLSPLISNSCAGWAQSPVLSE
jgi:hypothetical protein